MGWQVTRVLGAAIFALAAASSGAVAQGAPPYGASPYGAPQSQAPAANPVCVRLESQLALIDRGATDPARADQLARTEQAARQQQAELDRLQAQMQRQGCGGSGFFLFGGQSPQCADINSQIQRVRGALERTTTDLQRLQVGTSDRAEQRRGVLIALAQYDCGPQYRAAAPPRPQNFFEALFGGGSVAPSPGPSLFPGASPDQLQSGTYRTLCVRTCDGYYYPISYATVASRFPDDERTCQRTCPAAEVVLFTHRNPGEDVNQAVSLSGQNYRDLPNAFHYRQALNPSCSCRRPGQSWAEALGRDTNLERGDIVVTDEQAKAMSQPKPEAPAKQTTKQNAAKGKGAQTAAPAATQQPAATPPPAPAPAAAATPDSADPNQKKQIRSVGPQFIVR